MKTFKHRPDSLATIHLEDLFGPISIDSREGTSKYYPNTVPQPKVSSFKKYGSSKDDSFKDKSAAFSYANISKNRRISLETDSRKT